MPSCLLRCRIPEKELEYGRAAVAFCARDLSTSKGVAKTAPAKPPDAPATNNWPMAEELDVDKGMRERR